jgi:ParB family chromosome partitioning protein
MSKTKIVLGKGLNALIPMVGQFTEREISYKKDTIPVDDGIRSGVIASVQIAKINPNPLQPREDFDKLALEELKQSIVEKGVIQPITVRGVENGMRYEVISGERRIRACLEAGLANIPAYILEVTSDEEMLELALIENIQREHLNPIEIAVGYQRLIQECNCTQEDIAKKIGKDRTTVSNFIRLLKLPMEIQRSLRKNEISMGHARALVNAANEKVQLEIWRKTVKQGLSVRRVEQMVNDTAEKRAEGQASAVRKSTLGGAEEIETRLRHIFGTQVRLRPRSAGKGEILIQYYSVDDLDRILELFAMIETHKH